jgi:hypothetical protein
MQPPGLLVAGILLAVGWRAPLTAQDEEPLTVSTDHPRLFLRPARLRLLRRERERSSPRWQQFDALVAGNAPMPERGFAEALYYQVSGNQAAGRQAVSWALGPGRDLRQLALVFDWCQDLLSEAQSRDLAGRIARGMAETAADDGVAAVRSRVLAAVSLYDHVAEAPQRELQRVEHSWWSGKILPALSSGRDPIARDDAYAFYELLHALRDNTNLDLRDGRPQFFKQFAIEHLLSHYPAPFQAPENDYYAGATRTPGEPDPRVAALSRAAELAMVAYDSNEAENQFLQGWLMHDRYMLRSIFGAPYEFLWANPYQPGLSYYHMPLVYYTAEYGKLFVRSSWEDSANWFGYFDGVAQLFENGRVVSVNPRAASPPLSLGQAEIYFGPAASRFRVTVEEGEPVFIVGLEPRRTYEVEVDDEEMFEAGTGPGGILQLEAAHGKPVGVRIRATGP